MPVRRFDCNEYGDVSYKNIAMNCFDCQDTTIHQLAYHKGNHDDKVSFCTNCGKTYAYDGKE